MSIGWEGDKNTKDILALVAPSQPTTAGAMLFVVVSRVFRIVA